MTRSAYLIFNPVAGQGDSDQEFAQIRALLTPEFDLTIKKTTKEVGAGELARQAVKDGAKAVIAAGGDGTLSAVAGALIGTNIPLGIIARGTANAFASALGIADTLEKGCQTILAGNTKVIDTAKCNHQPMLLLAGIGFEADTIEETDNQAKDYFGILAYVLSGIQQLQEFEKFDVEIETETDIITVTAAAITVANVAPPTSFLAQGTAQTVLDDGLLDITIVAPENRAEAVTASYHLLEKALQNEAVERDDIGYRRVKTAKITANPPQRVTMDGELTGKTPITVECVPQSLTIFAPIKKPEEPSEQLEGLPNLNIESKNQPERTSSSSHKSLWISGFFVSLLLLILLFLGLS